MEGLQNNNLSHVSEKINVQVVENVDKEEIVKKSNEKKDSLNRQIRVYEGDELEASIESESGSHSNFRNYWTEDMDEVHKRVL